ncbi:alpha-amylase family glycosyl hydrolase [Isoptericola nanjingensis]|uniref:alpha-amylase family glycosyl hydrolase n=1 Tax=Isoptericola nanjingensis TaxID=903413 RepID=UPI003D244DB7
MPTHSPTSPHAAVDLAPRLGRTVLYQLYPQSFADGNGDGIGDLAGITARLDYLRWLGVGAVWLDPCFVSPFADAGYDVADFMTIAPRYGTNDDLAELTEEAGRRGIAVLLDLVAGHTSDQHPWFAASADDPDDDRYVWSDVPVDGFEPGPGRRGGFYLPNFFPVQPALNFGFARPDPAQPWRSPVDAAGPQANRAALREIMAHWFDLGVAGFRVDMAASLVKDDPGLVETGRLWRENRAWLDATYPGRVLISEWGDPRVSVPSGFHADFFLQFGGDDDGLPLRSLWNNGAGTVQPSWGDVPSWADAEARGDAGTFVRAWEEATGAIAAAGRGGLTGLPTSNHDFTRLVAGARDAEQARAALVLTLTWPSMPSIYYGDEIGMRFVPETPTLEGSRLNPTYDRAGSRTPMQWGDVPPGRLGPDVAESCYLPQDPDRDRPTVAAQLDDEGSLLHLVRRLAHLRTSDPRLDATADVDVLATGYPFAYLRGGTLAVVLNPGRASVSITVPGAAGAREVEARGLSRDGDVVHLDGHGYAVLDLA